MRRGDRGGGNAGYVPRELDVRPVAKSCFHLCERASLHIFGRSASSRYLYAASQTPQSRFEKSLDFDFNYLPILDLAKMRLSCTTVAFPRSPSCPSHRSAACPSRRARPGSQSRSGRPRRGLPYRPRRPRPGDVRKLRTYVSRELRGARGATGCGIHLHFPARPPPTPHGLAHVTVQPAAHRSLHSRPKTDAWTT